jgi:hypothetical protein
MRVQILEPSEFRISECVNLLLSARRARGEPQHPWDYLLGAKKESKICKKSEKPAILESLYNKVRTHFLTTVNP